VAESFGKAKAGLRELREKAEQMLNQARELRGHL